MSDITSTISDDIPIARRQPPQQTDSAAGASQSHWSSEGWQDLLRFHFDYCECNEHLYGRPTYTDCLLAIQQLPYYRMIGDARREIYGLGGVHPTPAAGTDGPPLRTPIVREFRKTHVAVIWCNCCQFC